jgi:sigma-B regulation protein RsbU (phosphoserine phosphatase)
MNETSESLLVVDDNEMNRDMLSRRLSRHGYTVALAGNGRQALDLIGRQRFDLVLLDVMMPEVDGLTVLEEVRQTQSLADLPVIMATSKDSSEDVVRALELGANDYVTKPLDFPVVLARVRIQLALRRANRALEAANTRMRRDLEAAAKIQRALIPRMPPQTDAVKFAWVFEPCGGLGGDILDVFRIDERRIGLYLLDVSGHGVPAALLSVTLSRMLSHMAGESLLLKPLVESDARVPSPAEVAGILNERFPMDPVTKQYFTLLYGILDLDRSELRYVCAGHPGPVHVRRGRDSAFLDSAGFAVGWFPHTVYEEASIELEPGDRVYLCSDGLAEARHPTDGFFGNERLAHALDLARSTPLEESVQGLFLALRRWCGEGGPEDDVSVLALERVR